MIYRTNKRTGDQVSIIGFGTSYIANAGDKAPEVIRRAYDGGVNYFDLATAKAATFGYFREALHDVRDKVIYQVHFGANYESGDYGWTTDPEQIKKQVEWMLKELDTDYIDYGFIHCLDELSDWDDYKTKGALDLLMEYKEKGIVKHLGLSTHTPALAMAVMNDVQLDMMMFSVNAAYDYKQGRLGYGSVDERAEMYRRCESEGIGISCMKTFGGGQLLDASLSPFGKALTQYQCFSYALDRPGVLTVLPGVSTVEQVDHVLGFINASDEEKDYSIIGSFKPAEAAGKCVYCNHCQPCPMGLEIGLINKYYDLAKNGDDMAKDHYEGLELHASDCVGCGHCNSRCPFGVDQVSRMETIKEYFGK